MKLVICEKPNAAEKIAFAIGGNKTKKRSIGKVNYWEIENHEKIIVVSAVGHLYTLKQKGSEWGYPVFDVEWAPVYLVEKTNYQKEYLDAIKNLSKEADEYICACDYDTEGSLIGYNILRYACNTTQAKRMKFSTLTKEELEEAWKNKGRFDIENALAGEARHILDWYYGINLSRALMFSLKKAGKNQIMSIGRVQGPTLAILAQREKEIASFVSKPYWEVFVLAKKVKFKHQKERFEKKEEAEEAVKKTKKNAVVEKIEIKENLVPPPFPFDLTTLQIEAHRVFNFEPKLTLEIAQRLYENALISYPRTSSQKLPPQLNLKKILEQISKNPNYSFAKELIKDRIKPNEGKKEDPAHPAIYPTGISSKNLSDKEAKLYDLIVKRFLACFAENAIRESRKIILACGSEKYYATGIKTIKDGWMKYYAPYSKVQEEELPDFKKDESLFIEDIKIEQKQTQPPKRYTSASIIAELEKRGLGTKATRAVILDTLFKRGYIEGKSITVTPFGMAVYELLAKNAPEILDEQLTRNFEEKMEQIKDGENERKIIEEGKKVLLETLKKFTKNEKEIGLGLLTGLRKKEHKEFGNCPKCKTGKIVLIKMKDGKQFLGCSNYPTCTNSYSLPSKVSITWTYKNCEKCGAPIIKGINKTMRFEVCANPSCK